MTADMKSFALLFALALPSIALHAFWTAFAPQTPKLLTDSSDPNIQCSDHHFLVFFWLTVSWNGILTLLGVYGVFQQRNMVGFISESKATATAFWNLIIFWSLFIGVDLGIPTAPNDLMRLLASLCVFVSTVVTITLILGPKIRALYTYGTHSTDRRPLPVIEFE